MSTTRRQPRSESFWLRVIYIASGLLCAAVAFILLAPRSPNRAATIDVSALPAVNASLNGLSSTLLLVGVYFARKRDILRHRRAMLSAFGCSGAFLTSYVIYHIFKVAPTPYLGAYRPLYLTILVTHIILATTVLPLALITLYRGWTGQVRRHRKLAKYALPVWLYVSLTGVIIYLMLYL